eukprot:GHVN01028202.1.p1 GENE.GHVN01028202.1~~GHVN01028202.1.p1  ORF type:complete len:388 (+),score=22.82 GHVN01028202.1:340-1503(+)
MSLSTSYVRAQRCTSIKRLVFFKLGVSLTLLTHRSIVVIAQSVCESALLPMDTLTLSDNMGFVCLVPWCLTADNSTHVSKTGKRACVPCRQMSWTGSSTWPQSDMCPIGLAACSSDGQCVGSETGWYNDTHGRPWDGINTWSNEVTISPMGETDVSAGEDLETLATYFSVCMGLDGVASLPGLMYGDYGGDGQASYRNNDLCYRITGSNNATVEVAVGARCGGSVICDLNAAIRRPNDVEPDNGPRGFQFPNGLTYAFANMCAARSGGVVFAGGQPHCDVTQGSGDGSCCADSWCYAGSGTPLPVDWCGGMDHPHFGLTRTAYDKVCGNAISCKALYVEPYLCAWNPPINPAQGEWGPSNFSLCGGSCQTCIFFHLLVFTLVPMLCW